MSVVLSHPFNHPNDEDLSLGTPKRKEHEKDGARGISCGIQQFVRRDVPQFIICLKRAHFGDFPELAEGRAASRRDPYANRRDHAPDGRVDL